MLQAIVVGFVMVIFGTTFNHFFEKWTNRKKDGKKDVSDRSE